MKIAVSRYLLVFIVAMLVAACGKGGDTSPAATPTAPPPATPGSGNPAVGKVPPSYGVFLVQNGALRKLVTDLPEPARSEFSANPTFLVSDNRLRSGMITPEQLIRITRRHWVRYNLVTDTSPPSSNRAIDVTVADRFVNLELIKCDFSPVDGHPEVVEIRPDPPLAKGIYTLILDRQEYPFGIELHGSRERDEPLSSPVDSFQTDGNYRPVTAFDNLLASFRSGLQTEIEGGHWDNAGRLMRFARGLPDPDLAFIAKQRDLALDVANKALVAKEWKKAVLAGRFVLAIDEGNKDALRVVSDAIAGLVKASYTPTKELRVHSYVLAQDKRDVTIKFTVTDVSIIYSGDAFAKPDTLSYSDLNLVGDYTGYGTPQILLRAWNDNDRNSKIQEIWIGQANPGLLRLINQARAEWQAKYYIPDVDYLQPHFIRDDAHVLSPGNLELVGQQLQQVERDTSNQIVVAIYTHMTSNDDIAAYGARVLNTWGVGQKGKNNGVLVLVFTQDRKIGITVGDGLTKVLPNATCGQIIENEIKPHFKNEDYDGGIKAGVTAIIAATRGEYHGTGQTQ